MNKYKVTPVPLLTIGLPVFNGAKTLEAVLDSLLDQTFTDYELIISDNCSTDGTEIICRKYAQKDARIRYIRQVENIGVSLNFKYVVDEARGEYFTWAAADDIRSPNFIECNVNFLRLNLDYVASTSPNIFEGQNPARDLVNFGLTGDFEDRATTFLDNCFMSHGIFYSVMRTDLLRTSPTLSEQFLGLDWAINLYLASKGKVNRAREGLLVLGRKGISSSSDCWSFFRTNTIEWVLPFYKLSKFAWELTHNMPIKWRIKFGIRLLILNIRAARFQAFAEAKRYIDGNFG